mgnify:FL=1
MKITKSQLQQIIKEELTAALNEDKFARARRKIEVYLPDPLEFPDVVYAGIKSASHLTGGTHDFIVKFVDKRKG